MEHIISINQATCIACGACIKDCPENNIDRNAERKAEIQGQACIKCGHCVAVCPVGAVSISGYSEAPLVREKERHVDPEVLLEAIQFRRSVRRFKSDEVSAEQVHMILEAGRYSPTGKNRRDIRYYVIQESKAEVEAMAVKLFRRMAPLAGLVNPRTRKVEITDDFLFRSAPLVIAISAKHEVDGALAAANMALMAESLGLGVLYSGFFAYVANASKKIQERMGMEGDKLVTTLVIGKPAVKYFRAAQREDADVRYC